MRFSIRSFPPPRASARGRYAAQTWQRGMLLGWLVATVVAAGVSVAGFRIDNSVGVWFETTDPALAEYRQSLDDFGHREWMLVTLHGVAADPAGRRADRERLVGRLRQLPDVHGVLSNADFAEDEPFVRQFLRPDPHRPDEALLIHVTNDIERQDGYREVLIDELRAAAADLPTVADIAIAGTAVINGELNRAARRDMLVFFPAVTLFLGLLGGALYRNLRDTMVLLSVPLGTVVLITGLMIGVGYPLNMVTIMLPTVLIALSVADTVHLIHAFHSFRRDGVDAGVAAGQAVRAIAWPCAGTTLTTIAGFLAFAGSSVLPVFQLAVFGALGIATAWLLTMTGGAVLLATLWRGRSRQLPAAARAGIRLVTGWWTLVGRHPLAVLAAFAAGGAALLGLGALEADTNYVKFFRSDARVPREYRVLQRAGFPQNPLSLVLELPAEQDALATHWQSMDAFARRLEALPGVHAVLTPFALAPTAAALGVAGRELGMLSRRGDRVQLTLMMDYPSSQQLLGTLARIRTLADTMLPADIRLTPTGTSLLFAHMDEGVIRTQRQSLAVVCVVCIALLALLFRSAWLGFIGLLVSLYPVAIVLGLMGLWQIPLNMATVLIAGIAVGLAVDDTIHFVHSWQAHRRSGADPRTACDAAMADVGLRTAMTSVILIGSFAAMGFSDFMPTAQFGLLSSLTILLALAADLTLLPIILTRGHAAARAASAATAVHAAWGRSS